MPGRSRTGHGLLARSWARLRGVAPDHAPDHAPDRRERREEKRTTLAAHDGDVAEARPPSLDEVLRDAAHECGRRRGEGHPTEG